MNDIYHFIVGSDNLSTVNAALLGLVFLLARQRYLAIVEEFAYLQKATHEHEMTFIKHGMDIQREP